MSGQPDNDCNCSYQLIHCKSPWSFVSKLPPKRVVECHPPSLRPLSGLRYAGSSLWRPASPCEVVVYSIMLNFIEYGQSIHRDRFSRLDLCELLKKGPPPRGLGVLGRRWWARGGNGGGREPHRHGNRTGRIRVWRRRNDRRRGRDGGSIRGHNGLRNDRGRNDRGDIVGHGRNLHSPASAVLPHADSDSGRVEGSGRRHGGSLRPPVAASKTGGEPLAKGARLRHHGGTAGRREITR